MMVIERLHRQGALVAYLDLFGTPTKASFVQALARIVSAEDARYTLLWDELSVRQKALLIALTKESGNVFSEAYRREHQLGAASSVQGAIARLKERELLDVRHGQEYTITDTFLPYWIAQVVLKNPPS
ncbi:MAG TPA: hypothetical protein V6D47_13580 [Oscillatoriaceae cyanobacterium]